MQILLLDIMNFVTIKYVASNYVTANFVNYAIADVTTAMSLPTWSLQLCFCHPEPMITNLGFTA